MYLLTSLCREARGLSQEGAGIPWHRSITAPDAASLSERRAARIVHTFPDALPQFDLKTKRICRARIVLDEPQQVITTSRDGVFMLIIANC